MLYAHQKAFLDKKLDRSALIWSCGTGKTKTAIEWSQTNKNYTIRNVSHSSTLIICPKALKTNWKNEVIKLGKETDYLVLTKEEFRKKADTLPNFDQVIVDEVHMGFLTPLWKSQMSKALKDYLKRHEVKRVLLLTATPYTSSPWNVYNLAYLTGNKWDWRKFRYEFFNDIRMGPRIVPVPKKGCEKKLAALIKKIADVVDINDVMDVPLQLHTEPEVFDLTPAQQRLIKDAYDPLPIVRFTAQHQIEQKGDKNERIRYLVEENDKVAIVCRYKSQIEDLALLLEDYSPYVISGDTKDRHSICLEVESKPRAVVIIQADCGVGFELPSFPICIFASMSYSYTSKKQMEGRFLRANKPSRTTFMYLLTEGDSVDRAIYNCMLKKEDFSIALYSK